MSTPWQPNPTGAPAPRREVQIEKLDHVPQLREALRHGGFPGVIYAWVLLKNVPDAKRGLWPDQDSDTDQVLFDMIDPVRRSQEGKPVWGDTQDVPLYHLYGPKGAVDVQLLSAGYAIRGVDPNNGKRRTLVDPEIYEMTGLADPAALAKPPTAKETPGAQVSKST